RLHKVGLAAFAGGMTDVICEPIARAVRDRGGAVETDAPVERILLEDGRVTGVVTRGRSLTAHHVIVAASLDAAQSLVRESGIVQMRKMLKLPSMPSVTLQLELDRPAM